MSSAAEKQRAKSVGLSRNRERAKDVGFVDSSLCAARLALWDSAASVDWFLPYLERMDAAGFAAIDILDPETAGLAVQQRDNPWRLLRLAATRLKTTPAHVWVSARCLLGAVPQGPDVIDAGIAALAQCRIRRVTCFDAANDVAAIAATAEICRNHGIGVGAALIHVDTPRQDVRYYADRARSLARAVPSITLVDIVGSIDPVTTRNDIAAIQDAAPWASIGFKTHCRSGVAEQCVFEAVSAGADFLYSCTDAMAGGCSLPPTAYFVEHLARRRIPISLDRGILAEMDEFFAAVAQARGLPLGRHDLPDASAERFAMPVALLRQLTAAAEALGVPGELLQEECLTMQKDLAAPTLAHPIGSVVVAQARTNVANGKRFVEITPDTAAYLRGEFGPVHASVSAELPAQAATAAPQERPVKPCQQSGAMQDRERRLLAAWFPECDLDALAGPGDEPFHGGSPQQYLKEQIERCPAFQSIRVRKGQFSFELQRNAEQALSGKFGRAGEAS